MARTTSNACVQRRSALAGILLALSGIAGPTLVQGGVTSDPLNTVFLAGGNAIEISPPQSVAPGALVSSEMLKVFREQQSLTLRTQVFVDVVGAGRIASPDELSFGKIQAGTRVDTYFIHGDAGGQRVIGPISGSIEFSQPIIGVLVSGGTLDPSDPVIGGNQTEYNADPARGLELDAGDWIEISSDRKTIRFGFSLAGSVDQIRVVTLANDQNETPTSMTDDFSVSFGGGGGMGDGGAGQPAESLGGDAPFSGTDGGGGSGSAMPLILPPSDDSSTPLPETPKNMDPPTVPPPPKDSVPPNPNDPPDHPNVPAPGGLLVMLSGIATASRRRRSF